MWISADTARGLPDLGRGVCLNDLPRFRAARPLLLLLTFVLCIRTPAQTSRPDWVRRSDQNTRVLLDVLARFEPEAATALGVNGHDQEISDLKPGHEQRWRAANAAAVDELRRRLAKEIDPDVRLDLHVLIDAAEREARGRQLREHLMLPDQDVVARIYWGIRDLLDPQTEPARRPAALVRLRKYVGDDPDLEPTAVLIEREMCQKLANASLVGPLREEVEIRLGHHAEVLREIGERFEQFHIGGAGPFLAKLKQQVEAYDAFVREAVLPRTRAEARLPAELYAFRLEEFGVDMPLDELRRRASASFRETQGEMEALAPLVAKEKGFAQTDYRSVLRELKKHQITGDELVPHFEGRIKTIEEIVRRENVVTLADRPMRFRVASEAESVMQPAPHFDPPRLIGNTGQQGEFVLPLRIPGKAGEASLTMDDFTYDAYTWTLTAHEGRPGHDLQFAALAEKGVSLARAVYADTSVNVEGWALYCEAEMKPYWPLDGQLATLQARLMRCARAFLDPGLQDGSVTRQEAMRVLGEDVVLSEGTVLQEVQRYTFRSPGQATSYFCGYQRLLELRADAERAMGRKFDRRAYHDFLLSQGLLPPKLMREAVMGKFVRERSEVRGQRSGDAEHR